MTMETQLRAEQSISAKLAIPRDDHILLQTLAIPLIVWCILASVIRQILPYTSSAASQNFDSFTINVMRNAGTAITFLFIYVLFSLLKNSSESSVLDDFKTSYTADPSKFIFLPIMLVAGLLSFMLFMLGYMNLKVRIPDIIPFSWDVQFAEWDKILFFGNDPWEVFAWAYDIPLLIQSIDYVYDAWAVLLIGSWISCFVVRSIPLARRIQFCLALLIAWFFGGNLLGILLSSAGPCYYANVTGGDAYYAGLLQNLARIDGIAVLQTQEMLWNASMAKTNIGGISAMPSMHCTTSFLIFLMFGRTRLTRTATLAFFVFIWCSSIILAWHYALDGLLAVPIALSSWIAAGWISRRVTSTSNAA